MDVGMNGEIEVETDRQTEKHMDRWIDRYILCIPVGLIGLHFAHNGVCLRQVFDQAFMTFSMQSLHIHLFASDTLLIVSDRSIYQRQIDNNI